MTEMWKRVSLFSKGSINATSFASGAGFSWVLSTAPTPLNLVFSVHQLKVYCLYVVLSRSGSVIFDCNVIMLNEYNGMCAHNVFKVSLYSLSFSPTLTPLRSPTLMTASQ